MHVIVNGIVELRSDARGFPQIMTTGNETTFVGQLNWLRMPFLASLPGRFVFLAGVQGFRSCLPASLANF